jgi:lipopolysaccharide/colanic/teichoic acid biosynthesis glycosyltransferase
MKIYGGESSSLTPSEGFLIAEEVVRSRLAGTYVRWVKPVLDRVLGLVLLILVSPIIVIGGLVILVTLGRPIFYAQERIGLNGRPFRLYKLRTMIPDRRATDRSGYHGVDRRRTHKSPHDPRVKPASKILRSLRLDELPQFWNVVKGDMSLVGPRPEMPEIVKGYQPWQHQRHLVKPGVTGPWQISSRNGKLMHECTEIDLEYIAQMSLVEDLRILMGTPLAMIGGRKGY